MSNTPNARQRLLCDVLTGISPNASPAEKASGFRAWSIIHAMDRDKYNPDCHGQAACLKHTLKVLQGETDNA